MSSDEDSELESNGIELEQGLVLPSEVFRVGGIRITPYDCPDCLRNERFNCDECLFFAQDECRLWRQVGFREELRTLFNLVRDRNIAYRRRQLALREAIQEELKAHGRPLHYTIIAKIVAERHPQLNPSPMAVLSTLSTFAP